MSIGWYASQNTLIERLAREVPVVWMGQTSKTSDTLIIPDMYCNNQPVPQPKRVTNNKNFSINKVVLVLVSGQVCAEAFTLIL